MKLRGLIITFVLLHAATSLFAQNVSLIAKDVPLADVLTTIKKQTGVLFFYDLSLMEDSKPVTVTLENMTVEKALEEVFRNQNLGWILEGKTVTIVRNPLISRIPLATLEAEVPLRHVSGRITDKNGHAIEGVSVVVRGTKVGTVTDKAGKFIIPANQINTLVFSSVNYRSVEHQVTDGEMKVILIADDTPLDPYHMGGNVTAINRKPEANAVTTLDSKTIEKIPANTLDQVFRGWVAGVNSTNVGPEPEGFNSLSIRGAAGPNSVEIIPVYVDGIEYAGGSRYLFQLDKNNIDRIEVVRGPSATTLYGTGSDGGIIRIFTKALKNDETIVNFTTSAGFMKSKWVRNDPLQQMHNLETTTAFKNIAIRLGGSYRTVGAYLPDGGEKNKGFYAGANFRKGKLQLNLIGRYNVRNHSLTRKPYYDTAVHPMEQILIEPLPGVSIPAYKFYNVQPTTSRYKNGITETYITGLNASHQTTALWTNNLSAGFTKNGWSEVPNNDGTAGLQNQYLAGEQRAITIRYSNVLNLYSSNNEFLTVLTSGLEYKERSMSGTITRGTAATTVFVNNPADKNYGAFVHLNQSYKNVYLTMGLRYEDNNLSKGTWNPRLGLTTNFKIQALTVKPKISWGRGVTAPSFEQRFGRPMTYQSSDPANQDIKPQFQQGFDYGLELFDQKGKLKFEVVYYNNIIKDMICYVNGNYHTNVCKVANSGWEFAGEYQLGNFSVQGTFTSMNSTMKDSTGSSMLSQLKLAPGERLINLPRHMAGLNLTYQFKKIFSQIDKGSISINVTEIDGVKSNDIINYSLDVSYGRIPYSSGTFAYPVQYSPVFRFGLYADYFVTNTLKFFVQGGNILNDYKYDFNNEFSTHGATWLFGLNYQFSNRKAL